MVKFGTQLTLCIPVESVTHFMEHIQNLVNTKQSDGKIYDFAKKKTFKLNVYISTLKAMEGDYGVYGSINPQKIEGAPNTQGLF